MIRTNSRYALVGYFITSYPTRAHGIIVIYYLTVSSFGEREHEMTTSNPEKRMGSPLKMLGSAAGRQLTLNESAVAVTIEVTVSTFANDICG